ncbi:CopD family protein [Porphyrobacter sp. GA68]|uniref:CopD family protein n=1 Tax=Porphyrobacter sp. GA68 TaxID=2883480 RepID=UPI001D194000|nr:CopD family protein [Porphyrobacter sp. GA68]
MEAWLHPLLRFAHYALLLGLFGVTAIRAFGLGRLAAGALPDMRLPVVSGCILAAVVSLALMVVSIAAMMGQPVASLDWPMFEVMVASTSMGWAFLIRLAALLAALGVLAFPLRRWNLAGAAVLLGVALATLAWSGHAAASEGRLGTLHRLSDALHLLASGVWIGAIGWFAHLVVAAHRRPNRMASAPLLATMHRFRFLGAALVGVVASTGILNAHLIFGLGNSGAVLGTAYGVLLAGKIAVVGAMLLLAGRNALLSRRAARESADVPTAAGSLLPALRRSLAAELSLAALVIGCVAVLGLMSPMG